MIVITGGDGFIGRNLVFEFSITNNKLPIKILDTKRESLNDIYIWLTNNASSIKTIIHLGAITDTTLENSELFYEYNLGMSMFIWKLCSKYDITLIYASSAATYGDGSYGFDDKSDIWKLKPLNLYGWSKHNFDLWSQLEHKSPKNWYGLKFFNVYGKFEEYKLRMSSMIYQIYNQIIDNGYVKLFKSNTFNILDGEQKRDFIHIDDVVNVIIFLINRLPKSGIYNVGTGIARSFNDIANIIFHNLEYNLILSI